MVERLCTGRLSQKTIDELDSVIDELVLEAYGFSIAERQRLRGGT